jgi:hypothetical protein
MRALKPISFPVMLVFFAILPLCYPQEKPPETPADRFLGAWKLNPEKSHPSNTMESLTIEYQEGKYKFVVDWSADNGTELNYWFVTQMKGDAATVTQMNGKPMSDVEHMVRVDTNSFVNDTKFAEEKYNVSKDGQTLKLSRTFKLGPKLPTEQLVFDRISNSR